MRAMHRSTERRTHGPVSEGKNCRIEPFFTQGDEKIFHQEESNIHLRKQSTRNRFIKNNYSNFHDKEGIVIESGNEEVPNVEKEVVTNVEKEVVTNVEKEVVTNGGTICSRLERMESWNNVNRNESIYKRTCTRRTFCKSTCSRHMGSHQLVTAVTAVVLLLSLLVPPVWGGLSRKPVANKKRTQCKVIKFGEWDLVGELWVEGRECGLCWVSGVRVGQQWKQCMVNKSSVCGVRLGA